MSKGDWKRPRDGGVSKEQYDSNFEAVFGKKEIKTWDPAEYFWGSPVSHAFHKGSPEWSCPHGIGHGNHIHGCDGCCSRKDYPGRKETDNEQEKPVQDQPTSEGGNGRPAASPTPCTTDPDRGSGTESSGQPSDSRD